MQMTRQIYMRQLDECYRNPTMRLNRLFSVRNKRSNSIIERIDVTKCLTPSARSLSLLSIVNLFSSLESKILLKVQNETFLSITRYITSENLQFIGNFSECWNGEGSHHDKMGVFRKDEINFLCTKNDSDARRLWVPILVIDFYAKHRFLFSCG